MYRADGESGRGLTPAERVRGSSHETRQRLVERALKRLFDLSVSLVLLIALTPLFAVLALAVKCSSPGPILFSQPRVGRLGREFRFYKFRSMRVDSEHALASFLDSDPKAMELWRRYQKIDRDPRVTSFGHIIRRSSLDELPQLFNVLMGDMSLVGPRPCMVDQRELYGHQWAVYCSVRPGLTGLWQVSGRSKLTYAQRVALDTEYVSSWSFGLDLKILLSTVRVVITGDGSK